MQINRVLKRRREVMRARHCAAVLFNYYWSGTVDAAGRRVNGGVYRRGGQRDNKRGRSSGRRLGGACCNAAATVDGRRCVFSSRLNNSSCSLSSAVPR